MPDLQPHEKRIEILFKYLDQKSITALPPRGTLANKLNELATYKGNPDKKIVYIAPRDTALFITCAVEMWLRSVHSFLISVSLSESSPIWASVCGYYSSHYCVRGFAHLLGFFQLHKARRVVSIEIASGAYSCTFIKKNGGTREHQVYWKIIKQYEPFKSDPFFTLNDDNLKASDGTHRIVANYYDHIGSFPRFRVLDENALERIIETISKTELTDVPIPRGEKYPDIKYVQLIAYHRIVKFRNYLNEILGSSSAFWNLYKNPTWCPAMNYQVVKPRFISMYAN